MRIKNGVCGAIGSVLSLLAACGGKSASNPGEPLRDVPTTSDSGGGAVTSSAGAASETGGSASGGSVAIVEGGETSVAGGSPGVAGSSSMSEGGSGGGPPSGAGGESGSGNVACIDTCQLRGAACCVPGGDCVSPTASCRIDVLKATIGVPRDYDELEQAVAEASPEILFSLTDADFAAAQVESWPGARIQLTLSDEASEAAVKIASDYLQSPFIVSCNGEKLFVGVTYNINGAAGIDAPVMHVIRKQVGNLTVRLGAWQGAWIASTAPEPEPGAKARLDRPELRAALCRRGALEPLP